MLSFCICFCVAYTKYAVILWHGRIYSFVHESRALSCDLVTHTCTHCKSFANLASSVSCVYVESGILELAKLLCVIRGNRKNTAVIHEWCTLICFMYPPCCVTCFNKSLRKGNLQTVYSQLISWLQELICMIEINNDLNFNICPNSLLRKYSVSKNNMNKVRDSRFREKSSP